MRFRDTRAINRRGFCSAPRKAGNDSPYSVFSVLYRLQRNLQKLREVLTYKDKYFFQICHSSCFYHKTFFLRNLWPNGCKLQIFTNLRGKLRTEFCCNYKNVILGSVKLHGIGSWPQSLKNSLILSLTINMKENTLSLI